MDARFDALKARFRREAAEYGVRARLADRAELERIAHRLSGNAGMFGYGDVGDRAGALEDALRDEAGEEEIGCLLGDLICGLQAIQAE